MFSADDVKEDVILQVVAMLLSDHVVSEEKAAIVVIYPSGLFTLYFTTCARTSSSVPRNDDAYVRRPNKVNVTLMEKKARRNVRTHLFLKL